MTENITAFLEKDSDRFYLCQNFLHTFSMGLAIFGWVWGVILIIANISLFSLAWLPPILMILAGVGGMHWAEEHLKLATTIALLGAGAALIVAAYAYHTPIFLLGLAFLILCTGVLSYPLSTALMAIGALIALGTFQKLWPLPRAVALAFFLAMGIATGLGWMLWHYISLALEMSYQSRERAVAEMLKAQQRRAELRRALKALDEGYERLRRLNQELSEARREAEEARRLKAEFAANVSHELRTPINLIIGFSEMMYTAPESYGGQPLPPEYLADVHAIYRSAKHLQSLIDDILDLSRIEARRMALTREQAQIDQVIREAIQVIRELVERKGLTLEVDIEENLPPLYLDRTRIRQVLLNLISNAVRFTERGFIRVSCKLRSGDELALPQGAMALPEAYYVCVSVADSGIGIRPEDMDKVFEEFRQVDGSPRRKHGGTGLGLAISKRFVEMHDGWMWVESEFGKGSTFFFVLPVADSFAGRSKLQSSREVPTIHPTKETILVLDKDPTVFRLFKRYLRGYQVVGTTTTKQALESIEKLGPKLLVITNNSADGHFEELLGEHPTLQNAQLTILAYPFPTEHHQALLLGLHDYLVKPITKDQLLDALKRISSPVRRLLIVEDDPDMMRLLERMLQSEEIQLQKAYSAEEAQVLLRSHIPDALLLDLALPGISGYELLEWMEHMSISVPTIVVTANPHVEFSEEIEITEIRLQRRSGFTIPEVLALTEIVASRFPSHYADAEAETALQPISGAKSEET